MKERIYEEISLSILKNDLQNLIKVMNQIKEFDITPEITSIEHINIVLEALKYNSSVLSADFSNLCLIEKDRKIFAKKLAETLSCNATLLKLDLSTNNLSDDEIEIVFRGFAANNKLQEINIGNNDISCVGMSALATVLMNNKSLKVLDLYNNRIGSNGAIAVGKVLEKNTSLRALSLIDNSKIGEDGISALVTMIEQNRSLCKLKLPFTNNQLIQESFIRAVQQNRVLISCRIPGNYPQQRQKITELIKNNIANMDRLCESIIEKAKTNNFSLSPSQYILMEEIGISREGLLYNIFDKLKDEDIQLNPQQNKNLIRLANLDFNNFMQIYTIRKNNEPRKNAQGQICEDDISMYQVCNRHGPISEKIGSYLKPNDINIAEWTKKIGSSSEKSKCSNMNNNSYSR